MERGLQCEDCHAGTFSSAEGSRACSDCPTGHYQNLTRQTACIPCPYGHFAPEPKSKTCEQCEPGRVLNLQGGSACTDCPEGSYTDEFGRTSCDICPAGTFSPAGASNCTPCDPNLGEYAPNPGSSSCQICTGERILVEVEEGEYVCMGKCVDGKYPVLLNDKFTGECLDCPVVSSWLHRRNGLLQHQFSLSVSAAFPLFMIFFDTCRAQHVQSLASMHSRTIG